MVNPKLFSLCKKARSKKHTFTTLNGRGWQEKMFYTCNSNGTEIEFSKMQIHNHHVFATFCYFESGVKLFVHNTKVHRKQYTFVTLHIIRLKFCFSQCQRASKMMRIHTANAQLKQCALATLHDRQNYVFNYAVARQNACNLNHACMAKETKH